MKSFTLTLIWNDGDVVTAHVSPARWFTDVVEIRYEGAIRRLPRLLKNGCGWMVRSDFLMFVDKGEAKLDEREFGQWDVSLPNREDE